MSNEARLALEGCGISVGDKMASEIMGEMEKYIAAAQAEVQRPCDLCSKEPHGHEKCFGDVCKGCHEEQLDHVRERVQDEALRAVVDAAREIQKSHDMDMRAIHNTEEPQGGDGCDLCTALAALDAEGGSA